MPIFVLLKQIQHKYYKSSVVSMGVTLRMTVELNSNSNVAIEIISKTQTRKQLSNQ